LIVNHGVAEDRTLGVGLVAKERVNKSTQCRKKRANR